MRDRLFWFGAGLVSATEVIAVLVHNCTTHVGIIPCPLQDPTLVPGYDGSLLRLAVDLTDRLLPAFDTPTGVPLSWVNLRKVGCSALSCAAFRWAGLRCAGCLGKASGGGSTAKV